MTQRVLVVDDDPTMQRWIGAVLGRLKVEVTLAASGDEAIRRARETDFDLALLDLQMPGMNGFDLAAALRADRPGLALIFLTAADDTSAKVQAFEAGASDYITKPFEPAELSARVRSALRTQALVAMLEDLATTDRLTGLLNRRALNEALESRLESLQDVPVRLSGDALARTDDAAADARGFTVLFLDLDRFKVINDSLGHQLGDELLIHVADALRDGLRDVARENPDVTGSAIARNGGDEFVAVIDGLTDAAAAAGVAADLIARLSRPLTLQDFTLSVNASIGIKAVTDAAQTVTEVLRDADTAMYRAKNLGKGRAVRFDRSMHEAAFARLALETDLQLAIADGQVYLHYQPIVCLETNRIVRFEGLARWRHPTRGLLSPDVFIPIAEETGLITPLGDALLAQACRQVSRWYERFGRENSPAVNVNLSAKQLYSPAVADTVRRCMSEAGIAAEHLGIELTESAIVQDVDAAAATMRRLREMGIYLSIDDFGTGYSSMATLRRFPFDAIKIDRAFVASMGEDRACTAIVSAVCQLAHNLGMAVVAEGVEAASELTLLQGLECSHAQGYLMSRPVPAEEATELIATSGTRFFTADADSDTGCFWAQAG